MKLKRNLFAVAAIAAALTSCSKTEIIDNNPVSKGGVEIQAKSVHQLVDGSVTRVPYVGNIAVDNKLEARVITFDEADASYADGTMIFATTFDPMAYNTTSASVTGSSKFPVVGGPVTGDEEYTMYGLYPATGWTEPTSVATLTDQPAITFTGKEDVMVAAKATTTHNNVVNGLYPTLTFKHQLTKLSVKVQAVDDVAKAVWSDLSSIKLVKVAGAANVPNTATYQPGTGNVGFTGNAPTSFWIINNSQVYTDTEFTGQTAAINIPNATASNIVPIAYSMVAPFAVAGTPSTIGDITLEVKAKFNGTEEPRLINLNFPNMLTSTAGYAFNITLSFTDGLDIVATAEVVDWIDGGNVGGIIM